MNVPHFHYQPSAEPLYSGAEIILPDKWLPNMPDLMLGPAHRQGRHGLPRDPGASVFYVIVQVEIVLIEKHFCEPPVAPPRRYPTREGLYVTTAESVLPSVSAQMDWLPDAEEAPPLLAVFQEGLLVYPLYETLPAPPAFHDVWQARDNFPPRQAARLAWEGQALSDASIYVPPVPVERWMTPPAEFFPAKPREHGWSVTTPLPIFTSQFLPPQAEIPVLALPRQAGLFVEQIVDPLIRVDHWGPAAADIPTARARELFGITESLPLSDLTPLDRWFEQGPDVVRPVRPTYGESVAFTTLGRADVQLSSWFVQASEPVRLDPFLAAWTRTPTEVLPIVVLVGSGLTGTLRTYPRLSGKLVVNP